MSIADRRRRGRLNGSWGFLFIESWFARHVNGLLDPSVTRQIIVLYLNATGRPCVLFIEDASGSMVSRYGLESVVGNWRIVSSCRVESGCFSLTRDFVDSVFALSGSSQAVEFLIRSSALAPVCGLGDHVHGDDRQDGSR